MAGATRSSKNIGPNVRRLRQAMALTQGQLAERIDSADATISRIERGRFAPGADLSNRLATALGVTLDELYGRNLEPDADALREGERRLLALVKPLDEGALDDVVTAVRLFVKGRPK